MNTRKAKPFPWTCLHCETKTVKPVVENYSIEVPYEGKLYAVCVQKAEIPTCSRCGRKVLTDQVNRQISAALREKLELLTPEEITKNIDALNMSQKDVAALLRIAPETISRWIHGSVIQSRAMDTVLRLLFNVPAAREYLNKTAHSNTAFSKPAKAS